MVVRDADPSEIDQLARLWTGGWTDAHLDILPADLVRLRTPESFRDRMAAGIESVRVIGPVGSPAGFSMIKDDELYQLYVAASARGSGVAAALIDDAERRLASNGVHVAWLACGIGNHRAAKFYEKRGWRRVGNMINRLDTPEGEFLLEVWRYEKEIQSRR